MTEMFFLGMLTMWVILNAMVWIMDFADTDFRFADLVRRGFPLCYVVTYLIQCASGLALIIPLFPICLKYKINPFYTKLSIICAKLDTIEKREEWLSKVKDEDQKEKWKSIFKDYSI